MSDESPRWRQDFPVHWENDQYVTRRELAKFLTLGSGLLVGSSALVALVGRFRQPAAEPRTRVAGAQDLPPGSSLLFRYPTDADPCILIRDREGRLAAYSQVCTHLSCAVVYRAEHDGLFCPCHQGVFSAHEGLPTAGPPTRRLPRIRLDEQAGEVWAVGVEL
jgi:Rieske Fe-S protein